tara:strand:- start:1491 stop:1775 length:285 start_codon:yes stop_codon:yes gene_type:complete
MWEKQMVIYTVNALLGTGIFEAFPSKREAEKAQKEWATPEHKYFLEEIRESVYEEKDVPHANGIPLTINKHNIKTKKDMIELLNWCKGDVDGLY